MNPDQIIGEIFALRAEQIDDGDLFGLFCEPHYAHELHNRAPCVVSGGRGSGKTTLLRGLAFDGYSRLNPGLPVSEWPYVGVYLRINSARVGAFQGRELSPNEWIRLFGHYVNLRLCLSIAECWQWVIEGGTEGEPADFRRLARAYGGPSARTPETVAELCVDLEDALDDLEHLVNGIGALSADGFHISSLGGPLDELVAQIRKQRWMRQKPFFFLLDEYENLTSSQQRVVNTLIKHAASGYTFKIGMRAYGWRDRRTLNAGETLQSPADFHNVDIEARLRGSDGFSSLARDVCQRRVDKAARAMGVEPPGLKELFPRLSRQAEAELLGVDEAVDRLAKRVEVDVARLEEATDLLGESSLFKFFVLDWVEQRDLDPSETLLSVHSNPKQWTQRFRNYSGQTLFRIRAGRVGIRKYYAGWPTFELLAATNLRFLLQLIGAALQEHVRNTDTNWHRTPIDPRVQTGASIAVARNHLNELEGVSQDGPTLTRLTAALGRLFQLLAETGGAHTPEVNQFRRDRSRVDRLLHSDAESFTENVMRDAVRHLALTELPSTKKAGEQVDDFDYMLVPLLAPLFSYSVAKKRKLVLRDNEIEGLIHEPSETLRTILRRQHRSPEVLTDPLPDSMTLFGPFYDSDDRA